VIDEFPPIPSTSDFVKRFRAYQDACVALAEEGERLGIAVSWSLRFSDAPKKAPAP